MVAITDLNPAIPDGDQPAGNGDDEIRRIKQALRDIFAGSSGDLWDTPLNVGPRALETISDKVGTTAFNALEARVSVNELAIVTQGNTFTDLGSRVTALENAGYVTSAQAVAASLAAAWPVGSIFIGHDNSTPNAKGLPGTWSQISNGQFLRNAGTAGGTGGANTYTLSVSQLPAHKHKMFDDTESSTEGLTPTSVVAWRGDYGSNRTYSMARIPSGGAAVHGETAAAGSGNSIDNQPSYLNVKIWRRTA